MNEYEITTPGRSVLLQWFAASVMDARREAEASGHVVKSIRLVQENVPAVCPGVVCKCHEPGHFCPAHGVHIPMES